VKFLAAKPDPGAYLLDFRVVSGSEEYQAIESTKIKVMVVVEAEITDGTITVAGREYEFTANKKLTSTLSLKDSQTLTIKFSVRNAASKKQLSVQQSLAKFTHVQSQKVFYALVPETGKSYTLDLDLSLFENLSGDYEIEIIVGDAHIEKNFKWVLSVVNINFSGLPLVSNEVDPFKPKAEISHKFREPEKQANATISSIFSLFVLAPLALFVLLSLTVGNINDWPKGSASMATLIFLGSLGAILLLDFYYWIGLDIFTTLLYLSVLGVAALFSGNTVLRFKAQNRLGKSQKQ